MWASRDWVWKKARASVRSERSVGKPKALRTATTPRVDSDIGVFSTNSARQIASACCVLEKTKYFPGLVWQGRKNSASGEWYLRSLLMSHKTALPEDRARQLL